MMSLSRLWQQQGKKAEVRQVLAARYEEEYVKGSGEWRFTQLKVFSSFMTPYEQRWAQKEFVLGVQAREKSQEELLCESLMEMRIF